MIAGAANNQLARGRDRRAAGRRAGSSGRPDFVANAGGIINIAVELEPGGYDAARAARAPAAIGDTLARRCSTTPSATDVTPLAAAMEIAYRRLAEAEAASPARPPDAGATSAPR